MRPAHLHFLIHKPGFKTIASQVYDPGRSAPRDRHRSSASRSALIGNYQKGDDGYRAGIHLRDRAGRGAPAEGADHRKSHRLGLENLPRPYFPEKGNWPCRTSSKVLCANTTARGSACRPRRWNCPPGASRWHRYARHTGDALHGRGPGAAARGKNAAYFLSMPTRRRMSVCSLYSRHRSARSASPGR